LHLLGDDFRGEEIRVMMFLESSAMIVAGLWLIRRANRGQGHPGASDTQPDLEYSLKMAELEYRAATNKTKLALLDIKERELHLAEGRELDRLVATDALHREERAKAALIAVLRSQGCNEDQIESLLEIIDNEPG
jgi:hypothetical protein